MSLYLSCYQLKIDLYVSLVVNTKQTPIVDIQKTIRKESNNTIKVIKRQGKRAREEERNREELQNSKKKLTKWQ